MSSSLDYESGRGVRYVLPRKKNNEASVRKQRSKVDRDVVMTARPTAEHKDKDDAL
jgi:hypothetical protein